MPRSLLPLRLSSPAGFLAIVLAPAPAAIAALEQSAADRFVESSFREVSDLAALPAPVPAFVRKHTGEEMALPGAAFHATDLMKPGLPWRRLILAGESKSLVFVWYEHGGLGYHQHLLIFEDPAQPRLVFNGLLFGDARTLADLKSLVAAGKVRNEVQHF
jgi:hypothetical protein